MVRMRDGVRENGRIKLKKGERKEIRKGNRKRINYPFLLYLIVTETLSLVRGIYQSVYSVK